MIFIVIMIVVVEFKDDNVLHGVLIMADLGVRDFGDAAIQRGRHEAQTDVIVPAFRQRSEVQVPSVGLVVANNKLAFGFEAEKVLVQLRCNPVLDSSGLSGHIVEGVVLQKWSRICFIYHQDTILRYRPKPVPVHPFKLDVNLAVEVVVVFVVMSVLDKGWSFWRFGLSNFGVKEGFGRLKEISILNKSTK